MQRFGFLVIILYGSVSIFVFLFCHSWSKFCERNLTSITTFCLNLFDSVWHWQWNATTSLQFITPDMGRKNQSLGCRQSFWMILRNVMKRHYMWAVFSHWKGKGRFNRSVIRLDMSRYDFSNRKTMVRKYSVYQERQYSILCCCDTNTFRILVWCSNGMIIIMSWWQMSHGLISNLKWCEPSNKWYRWDYY